MKIDRGRKSFGKIVLQSISCFNEIRLFNSCLNDNPPAISIVGPMSRCISFKCFQSVSLQYLECNVKYIALLSINQILDIVVS